MDLRLFKRPLFSLAVALVAIRAFVLFGSHFILPVFLHEIKGFDAVQTGWTLMPGPLMLALFSPVSGRLADRFGARYLVLVGSLMLVLFFFQYRTLSAFAPVTQLIWPMILQAMGIGLMIVPLSKVAVSQVPAEKSADVSTMLSLIPLVAGSVGIAVMSLQLSHRSKYHLELLTSQAMTLSPEYWDRYHQLTARVKELGLNSIDRIDHVKSALMGFVKNEAMIQGFRDVFLLASVILLLGVIGSLFLPKVHNQK
jgi:MFS family permease